MLFQASLDSASRRMAVAIAIFVLCALLAYLLIDDLVVGTIADQRIKVGGNILAASVQHFPSSPRLHARLAEAEMTFSDGDLARAQSHALRAEHLSPYDYRLRLLSASIRELRGDVAAAEMDVRAALALAPHSVDVRWRLANLLLREGKLDQAIEVFGQSARAHNPLLPATLDLIWRATAGDLSAAKAVAGSEPSSELDLARFLLRQNRAEQAAEVFAGIDRGMRLASPQASAFLTDLIQSSNAELARKLWIDLISRNDPDPPLIWNGGFESGLIKGFAQFDWAITPGEYAAISVDSASARTGKKSLRVDFLGRDTTRLAGEIRQMVVLRPGGRYRLECYVKTDRLDTPEGPRVVVTDVTASWTATTAAVPGGTIDWQPLVVNFSPPADPSIAAAVFYIEVKRIPLDIYDEPTRGVVWFDDFKITEERAANDRH